MGKAAPVPTPGWRPSPAGTLSRHRRPVEAGRGGLCRAGGGRRRKGAISRRRCSGGSSSRGGTGRAAPAPGGGAEGRARGRLERQRVPRYGRASSAGSVAPVRRGGFRQEEKLVCGELRRPVFIKPSPGGSGEPQGYLRAPHEPSLL